MEINVGGMGTGDNIAFEVEASKEEEDEDGSKDLMRRRRQGGWRGERSKRSSTGWARRRVFRNWCDSSK